MRILITGGGGFIGSAIIENLLNYTNHSIRVLERSDVLLPPSYRKFNNIEWQSGEFKDYIDILKATEGIDVVIHLASATIPKSSNDDAINDVSSNLLTTLNLLNAMKENRCKKIIFASSGGTVYGIPKYLPIDEQHPTDPIVSYGIVKLTIEKYIMLYQQMYGVTATILRISNPYGPGQNVESSQGVLTTFLYRNLLGEGVEIWGDGSVERDYLYIKDVADAFVKAINYCGSRTIFNISSGLGVSINEIINKIEKVTKKTMEKKYLECRPFDVPVNILSNKLAIEELGWEPEYSLNRGIEKTNFWLNGVILA